MEQQHRQVVGKMIDISKCKFNKTQLSIGKKIEMEHTNNPMKAEIIAKQHLCEFPEYYTALKKMEAKLKR